MLRDKMHQIGDGYMGTVKINVWVIGLVIALFLIAHFIDWVLIKKALKNVELAERYSKLYFGNYLIKITTMVVWISVPIPWELIAQIVVILLLMYFISYNTLKQQFFNRLAKAKQHLLKKHGR